MLTILDALKAITMYPIPKSTIEEVVTRRGGDLSAAAPATTLNSEWFNLAKADLLVWLTFAPNISQGGQSYSLTDEQRKFYRKEADKLYRKFGESEKATQAVKYGYKGSKL